MPPDPSATVCLYCGATVEAQAQSCSCGASLRYRFDRDTTLGQLAAILPGRPSPERWILSVSLCDDPFGPSQPSSPPAGPPTHALAVAHLYRAPSEGQPSKYEQTGSAAVSWPLAASPAAPRAPSPPSLPQPERLSQLEEQLASFRDQLAANLDIIESLEIRLAAALDEAQDLKAELREAELEIFALKNPL